MTIKLITGVMRSGKSELLIDEIEKFEGFCLILKPYLDTRNGSFVWTRAHDRKYPAVLVDEDNDQLVSLILNGVRCYNTVFIDEVQFFSKAFIDSLINTCELHDVDIIVSGLTKNFKGEYFPSMRSIWNRVQRKDTVILFGECFHCHQENASVVVLMDENDRILTEGETVQIEGETKNHYESLCDECMERLQK